MRRAFTIGAALSMLLGATAAYADHRGPERDAVRADRADASAASVVHASDHRCWVADDEVTRPCTLQEAQEARETAEAARLTVEALQPQIETARRLSEAMRKPQT